MLLNNFHEKQKINMYPFYAFYGARVVASIHSDNSIADDVSSTWLLI